MYHSKNRNTSNQVSELRVLDLYLWFVLDLRCTIQGIALLLIKVANFASLICRPFRVGEQCEERVHKCCEEIWGRCNLVLSAFLWLLLLFPSYEQGILIKTLYSTVALHVVPCITFSRVWSSCSRFPVVKILVPCNAIWLHALTALTRCCCLTWAEFSVPSF